MVPAGVLPCSSPFRDHESMVPAIQGIIKRQNSGLGHPFGPQAPAHGAAPHMRGHLQWGFHTPRTLSSRFLTRRFVQALTNRGIQLRMKHPKSVADCHNHTLHLEGSINDSRHLENSCSTSRFRWR
jgi:hypothetical protein